MSSMLDALSTCQCISTKAGLNLHAVAPAMLDMHAHNSETLTELLSYKTASDFSLLALANNRPHQMQLV